jgi:hypothetical protein
MEIANLARSIYGQFAPEVSLLGQIGEVNESKEPLQIHVMSRVQGISSFDFVLAHNSQVPEN